ncbi:MAG: hypothetical protein AAF499_09195 [Pseudomonadota bacterium]
MESKAAWVGIIAALITSVGGLGSTWMQLNAQEQEINAQEIAIKDQKDQISDQATSVMELSNNTVGSLEEGQKMCSVVVTNNWRDSFIVPRSWTAQLCEDYKDRVKAVIFQLGCVFPDQVVLSEQGEIPRRNCGW